MALADDFPLDIGHSADIGPLGERVPEPISTLVLVPQARASRFERLAERLAAADVTPRLDVRTVSSTANLRSLLAQDDTAVSCLVSPYDLPETTGLDLYEDVRSMEVDLPFVLVAENGDEDVASRAVSAGVTDYYPLSNAVSTPSVLANRLADAVEKRRLEHQTEQGLLALETTRERVALLDESGAFTYVTDTYADAYGYDTQDLLGQHWSILYSETEAERIRENVLPLLRETGFWAGEVDAERANGATFTSQQTLTQTSDGRYVSVVADRGDVPVEASGEALHELYDLAASSRPFEEKIERLLELGCDYLGVGMGMLTCEHESAFEIERMIGTHPELEEGVLTPPMTDNYCRRVVDTGNLISVADAGAAGWDGDALYDEFDLSCYAGVEVTDGDDIYGTICFTDLSPRDRAFTQNEQTFIELMGQCVSYELERKQREDHLTALNALGRDLMDGDTVDDVCERIIDAAETTLGFPVAAIARYEDDLRPVAQTEDAAALFESVSFFDTDEAGWQAFVEGERRRVTDLSVDGEVPVHPPVTELVALPIATYGVFVVGSTASDGFTATDIDFAETVAANAEAAIERADREQRLKERERTLEAQNEKLSRLTRINDIIRSIDQALVSASTREEIETVVCQELANASSYELAWIGTEDPHTNEVVPREVAGTGADYVDNITITVDPDDPEGQGPTGRAIRTHEPQVNVDVLSNRQYEPWRREALDRGYHASIALPLVYEDSLYGVLNVYANEADVFSDLERTVLAELSNTIAYAINSVESKKALVSERVTELDFRLADDTGLLRFTTTLDCELSFEALVTETDGAPRVFFTTRGAPVADVLTSSTLLPVSDFSLVNEYEEGGEPAGLFEATLTDGSLLSTLLDHGAVVRELSAADGEATLTVELPSTADVREFKEMFQRKYSDTELLAQRTRARTQQTRNSFKAALMDELTTRQLEAIQTAYFSGFFETPRERTGTEVADTIGVSQPTFNNHIRVAQRKLCQLLFEEQTLDEQ